MVVRLRMSLYPDGPGLLIQRATQLVFKIPLQKKAHRLAPSRI